MAKTKTDTIPTTIKIPGGSATFYTDADLPPRRERALELLQTQLNPRKLKRVIEASRVLDEDGEVSDDSPLLDGPDAVLDEHEATLLLSLGETTAWAYLKSWTLQITTTTGETSTSVPRPLPQSPDEFLDLPKPLFKALTDHGAKLSARNIQKDGFGVDSAGDESSPTTA